MWVTEKNSLTKILILIYYFYYWMKIVNSILLLRLICMASALISASFSAVQCFMSATVKYLMTLWSLDVLPKLYIQWPTVIAQPELLIAPKWFSSFQEHLCVKYFYFTY